MNDHLKTLIERRIADLERENNGRWLVDLKYHRDGVEQVEAALKRNLDEIEALRESLS